MLAMGGLGMEEKGNPHYDEGDAFVEDFRTGMGSR